MALGYDYPQNIKSGERIVLEDNTVVRVTAVYPLGEKIALEVDEIKQIIQADPVTKIRVLRGV